VKNRIAIAHPADALTIARIHRHTLTAGLVLSFAFLTAVGALVRIPLPFTPVPLTLQTFFVLLSGALLGVRRGFASQTAYLGLGAMGLPVFAGAGSPVALAGPTGGYLIGFAVASPLVGVLTRGPRGRSLAWTAAAMGLGLCVIYSAGALQLAVLTHAGPGAVLSLGVIPFLPGAAAKLTAAAAVSVAIRAKLAR